MLVVTKRKYDEMAEKLAHKEYMLEDMQDKAVKMEGSLVARDEEIMSLKETIDKYEEEYDAENSVLLRVGDDLTQVVPFVRVKPQVFDKMVELGYLDDTVNSENKGFMMQTALLVVVSEALEQIVDSMTQPLDIGD